MLLSIWLMVVWEVSRVWFGKLPFLTQMKVSDSVEKLSQNAKKFSQLPSPVVNHFQVRFNIRYLTVFSSEHMILNQFEESLFWLLVTGEVPSQEQVNALSAEWAARAGLPAHVEDMLNSLPSNVHPMSQFSAAVTLMNTQSKFAKVKWLIHMTHFYTFLGLQWWCPQVYLLGTHLWRLHGLHC